MNRLDARHNGEERELINGRNTSRAGSPLSSADVSRCSRSNVNPSHFPGPTSRDAALD